MKVLLIKHFYQDMEFLDLNKRTERLRYNVWVDSFGLIWLWFTISVSILVCKGMLSMPLKSGIDLDMDRLCLFHPICSCYILNIIFVCGGGAG